MLKRYQNSHHQIISPLTNEKLYWVGKKSNESKSIHLLKTQVLFSYKLYLHIGKFFMPLIILLLLGVIDKNGIYWKYHTFLETWQVSKIRTSQKWYNHVLVCALIIVEVVEMVPNIATITTAGDLFTLLTLLSANQP